MIEEKAKSLAHELTIEYIRKRSNCLSGVEAKIPEMVDEFANLNKKFYEAILDNKDLDELY